MRSILSSINPEFDDQRKEARAFFNEFQADFNLESAADLKINRKLVYQNNSSRNSDASKENERFQFTLIISSIHVLL